MINMKTIVPKISKFLHDRNWNDLAPSDVAKSISIEAAELLELFQWTNPTAEDVKSDSNLSEKIGEELADVIIYAIEMAIILDLDPKLCVINKINKADLKYPAATMNNNRNADASPANEEYYAIKKQVRKENGNE